MATKKCVTRGFGKNIEKLYTVAMRKLLFMCHFFFNVARQMEDFLNLLDLFYPSGKDPIGRRQNLEGNWTNSLCITSKADKSDFFVTAWSTS